MVYRPSEIEARWQQYWDVRGTFVAHEDLSRPKFYALDMFPYPSAVGLHVGHPAGYTAGDVVCRFRRARGFNVLHPMGWDAFGLPAEQRAIREGVPPQVSTAEAIDNFRRQLKSLGFSYDWSREVSTADPAYYRWTQAIFALLYNRGLAYQAETYVNWCPALGTVLANDEVMDGRSERGGHPVERRRMRQWMLKITDFAERLLSGLDQVDWPEQTRASQREWIGRSEGATVDFRIEGLGDTVLPVFTTRPDTLWGVTYLVLAPEHPMVDLVTAPERRAAVSAYQRATAVRSEVDRKTAKVKTGEDTGARARNPVNGESIPVWIADYVIQGYGTGAIMAVPAHDERDWDFAHAMGLPVRAVISGGTSDTAVHTGDGEMMHSGDFDGTPTAGGVAMRKVIDWLSARGVGKGTVTYRFHDWVFARQRYWGEPIPVLKDGDEVVRALTVAELPVVLPAVTDYAPRGKSPLASVPSWVAVDDPVTGRKLQRETDTMPGSAGSSWYFLRYCDPHNADEFCAREKSDYWMPVDLYVGGSEHRVGHLMYARMWQKALFDAGLVRDEEPFAKLRHQGMVLGDTFYGKDKVVVHSSLAVRQGEGWVHAETGEELTLRQAKMSKRSGNAVNPDDVVRAYGADALRVYLCFMGPVESDKPWQTTGLEAQFNWLKRAWRLYFEGDEDAVRVTDVHATDEELRVLHRAIKKVTEDIDAMALNTAVSALHVATRDLGALGTRARSVLEALAQLIAPFAPHFAEEVWARGLGHSLEDGGITFVPWPGCEERWVADDTVTLGVQVNGKTHGTVVLMPDADEDTAMAAALAVPTIARHIEGRTIVRVIYKAGRILNVVVK